MSQMALAVTELYPEAHGMAVEGPATLSISEGPPLPSVIKGNNNDYGHIDDGDHSPKVN